MGRMGEKWGDNMGRMRVGRSWGDGVKAGEYEGKGRQFHLTNSMC